MAVRGNYINYATWVALCSSRNAAQFLLKWGGARQHFGWHNPMPICNHESAHVPDIGGVVHMPAWYQIIVGIGRCGVIWMKPRLRFGTVRKIPRAW